MAYRFPTCRVVTAGDTIDAAMQQASEVLEFAAEDWRNPDGSRALSVPTHASMICAAM